MSLLANTYPPASAERSKEAPSVGFSTTMVGLNPVARMDAMPLRILSISVVPVVPHGGATIWAKTWCFAWAGDAEFVGPGQGRGRWCCSPCP